MSSGPAALGQNACPHPGLMMMPNAPPSAPPVVPSKRSEDDIQFISCKPVKKRKVSEANYQPVPPPARLLVSSVDHLPEYQPPPQHQPQHQQHSQAFIAPMVPVVPMMHLAHVAPASATESEKTMDPSHERRVSTGMVGLPSDFHEMDPSFVLRGVSLPVLENFALDQPFRRPKPISPPALSPRQLPGTISPVMLNVNTSQVENNTFEFLHARHSTARSSATGDPANIYSAVQAPMTPDNNRNGMVHDTPLARMGSPCPASGMSTANPSSSMPPPPCPRIGTCSTSDCSQQNDGTRDNSPSTPSNASRPPAPKQPCQICARMQQMRQQAALARSQGMPMMNPNMPDHMLSQMPCPLPYPPHSHAHLTAMTPPNLPGFGPGFGPMVMPMNMPGYRGLMQRSGIPHSQQLGISRQQQPGIPHPPQPGPHTTLSTPTHQSSKPGESSPTAAASSSNAKPASPANALNLPASLMQPSYRKYSPNLIVDVAETCQGLFPFEEVAKRHNAPVDKVCDVFAAIIQVPLLRCDTDRRRPGKTATTRVREYNKAKSDIQESRSAAGNKYSAVSASEVAQRMGPAELPKDLTLH